MRSVSEKQLRDDLSPVLIFGGAAFILLLLAYNGAKWFERQQEAERRQKEFAQNEAAAKEEQRKAFYREMGRDIRLNQRPIWSGRLARTRMTPWIAIPSGHAWTIDYSQDVKLYYIAPGGEGGTEVFRKNESKQLVILVDKIRFQNIGDATQNFKVWVYRLGDNSKSITLPGGETLSLGAPVVPSVDGQPAEPQLRQFDAFDGTHRGVVIPCGGGVEPSAMGTRGHFCIRKGVFAYKAEFNEGTEVASGSRGATIRSLRVGDDVEIDVNVYGLCTQVRVVRPVS